MASNPFFKRVNNDKHMTVNKLVWMKSGTGCHLHESLYAFRCDEGVEWENVKNIWKFRECKKAAIVLIRSFGRMNFKHTQIDTYIEYV